MLRRELALERTRPPSTASFAVCCRCCQKRCAPGCKTNQTTVIGLPAQNHSQRSAVGEHPNRRSVAHRLQVVPHDSRTPQLRLAVQRTGSQRTFGPMDSVQRPTSRPPGSAARRRVQPASSRGFWRSERPSTTIR